MSSQIKSWLFDGPQGFETNLDGKASVLPWDKDEERFNLKKKKYHASSSIKHFSLMSLSIDWNWNFLKNASISSSSHSWSYLEKWGFRHPLFPSCFHTSTIHASLVVTIENIVGKASPRENSLHLLSFQNFTLCPLPLILELKASHPHLIAFHTPTPYLSLTTLEHHPPSFFSCFRIITFF